MRECWVNIYPEAELDNRVGVKLSTRKESEEMLKIVRHSKPWAKAFRVHVKLKPEGAPKRYPHPGTRKMWETDTEFMRLFS